MNEVEGADGPDRDRLEFIDGLLPVVTQDVDSERVLMLAYASPQAVERTLETGEAHYYSRSRGELWHKGSTSGNVQHVREVRVDCDADTLLYRVEQEGGACHTGFYSCFHRRLRSLDSPDVTASPDDGPDSVPMTSETIEDPVFEPEDVYGSS